MSQKKYKIVKGLNYLVKYRPRYIVKFNIANVLKYKNDLKLLKQIRNIKEVNNTCVTNIGDGLYKINKYN